eukprot:2662965-Pleurochrysis_carterae.AAC.1
MSRAREAACTPSLPSPLPDEIVTLRFLAHRTARPHACTLARSNTIVRDKARAHVHRQAKASACASSGARAGTAARSRRS